MKVHGTTRTGDRCTLTTDHPAAVAGPVLLVKDVAYKADDVLPDGSRPYILGPVHTEDPRRGGMEAFTALHQWNVQVSQARSAASRPDSRRMRPGAASRYGDFLSGGEN